MASRKLGLFVAAVVSAAAFVPPSAVAQLRTDYYASVCPNLESIVRAAMTQAVSNERRIGASLLRLFFHDCFVQVRYRTLAQSFTLFLNFLRNTTANKYTVSPF